MVSWQGWQTTRVLRRILAMSAAHGGWSAPSWSSWASLRILSGVANYFRHAAVKRTLHYLTWYSWWRVMRWIRAKHPKASWTWLRSNWSGP
jgi:hypothetical protein